MTPRLDCTCTVRFTSVQLIGPSLTRKEGIKLQVGGRVGREAGAQGGSACGLQTKWAVERQESAWDWSTVPPRSGTRAAGSVRTLRSRPFLARQPILVQCLSRVRARGAPSSPSFPFPSPLRLCRKEGCCCVVLYCVQSECEGEGEYAGESCSSCSWPGWLELFFLLLYPSPRGSPSPPSPFPFSPS